MVGLWIETRASETGKDGRPLRSLESILASGPGAPVPGLRGRTNRPATPALLAMGLGHRLRGAASSAPTIWGAASSDQTPRPATAGGG